MNDLLNEHGSSAFGQFQKCCDTQRVFHFVDKVGLLKTEYVHCHFASVQVHAEGCSRLHKFLERRHVVFTHQRAEDFWTYATKIESACRRHVQAAHHKSEHFREPVSAHKRASFLLFYGVEPPKRKENVYFVTYRGRTSCKRKYSRQFVKFARKGN